MMGIRTGRSLWWPILFLDDHSPLRPWADGVFFFVGLIPRRTGSTCAC
ncbi:hypothetical protein AB205_0158370 [Aquarana catesbeiana]|uniref:Uncharacterized protein n=1 Tax=Aquarana catesbeiana TaxID=8400 RepID=A0A2G9QAG2_AQUCT|nr:hypothetical protein AB205_0158370 [Aquarana catesbeiana]